MSTTSSCTPENIPTSTVVYDANATDADGTPANSTISYSLTGADAARFSIDSVTGEVRFLASPNFESPQDSGGNNVYDVIVHAGKYPDLDGCLRCQRDRCRWHACEQYGQLLTDRRGCCQVLYRLGHG